MGHGILVDDAQPCPICDEFNCSHEFYGEDFYRLGDAREKHPIIGRRTIRTDRRIHHPISGQLLFAAGDLMTPEEAEQHGVPIPGRPAAGRKKGQRRRPSRPGSPTGPNEDRPHPTESHPQGPTEDRAHHPQHDRTASRDPHNDDLPSSDR